MFDYKGIGIGLAMVCISSNVFAADPYVYPSKGQSPEQMEKDKYQCYGWAKEQTGFDPMNPPKVSSGQAEQGSVLGGAARGAAGGAIIGAIAGDAGKGAAIGAGVGGVGRGMKNNSARRSEQASQEHQAANISAMESEYHRAYGVCLEGRGYSVK